VRTCDRNEALRELADSIAMFEAEKEVLSRFSKTKILESQCPGILALSFTYSIYKVILTLLKPTSSHTHFTEAYIKSYSLY
jgi:hypothetical protein